MNIKPVNFLFKKSDDVIPSKNPNKITKNDYKNRENILYAMECESLGQKANIHTCKSKMKLLFSPENITLKEARQKTNNLIRELKPEEKISGANKGIASSNPVYTTFPENTYQINNYIHSNKGYTSDLDDCIAVILHNATDSYMFHLAPNNHKEPEAVEAMQERLAECINELQNGNSKCNALLIGGAKCESSHILYENISSVLKDKDVKPQEILFCDGLKDVYYDINKGIILNHDEYSCIDEIKRDFGQVVLN